VGEPQPHVRHLHHVSVRERGWQRHRAHDHLLAVDRQASAGARGRRGGAVVVFRRRLFALLALAVAAAARAVVVFLGLLVLLLLL
jgi:hypothetical protein